jgi:NAD(P)-dependent dehydrogenase (short-subunit alcohol dehydrogenase family)
VDLAGRRILITGASTGIGAALARQLGARGATLGLVARRGELLAAVLDAARAAGAGAASRWWSADLADTAAAGDLAARAWDELGGLDAFVSNAAMTKRRHSTRLDPAELDQILRVNFVAPATMALRVLPMMAAADSGTIVMVGSIAGRVSSGGEASYVASKHALAGFTETLAVDLAGTGVRVHLVTPGPFDTDIWQVTDDEPTFYAGPKHPPSVAADAIIEVLEGTDRFETCVPADVAGVIGMKNGDVDGWIALASQMAASGSTGVAAH